MPDAGFASTTPIIPSGAAPAGASKRSTAIKNLDRDDFLQLLIAQLRNQDPLKPMEDREFIAQLAQFRTLEQMESMTASFKRLIQAQQLALAGALIGRTVQATGGVAGVVGKVSIEDEALRVHVGGRSVGLDAVTEVR